MPRQSIVPSIAAVLTVAILCGSCVTATAPQVVAGIEGGAPINGGSAGGDGQLPDDGSSPGPDDSGFSPIGAGSFTVRLDSQASPDGGIAVRVFHPSTESRRYEEGAPLAIVVPGGHAPALVSRDRDADVLAAVGNGVIHVSFSMPGAIDVDAEGTSGGEYDYRGPNCKRALADTILYAMGRLADADGQLITDRLAFAIPSNVGLVALSNGGNLALTALADFAEELEGLAWLITWESPIGDQTVTVELGGGSPAESSLNPFYTPGDCELTSCPWPGLEDALAFDLTTTFLLEDPANGSTRELAGLLYVDSNGNRTLDANEFSFNYLGGPGDTSEGVHTAKAYVSSELADLVEQETGRLFLSGRPTWMASKAEVDAYWAERDGSLALGAVVNAFPEMPAIALASSVDHVQAQPDHPHVRSMVNGWRQFGGIFIRLNPDSAYLAKITGLDPTEFPDNLANLPIPYPGIDEMLEPETVGQIPINSTVLQSAAIHELTDRTWADTLAADLNDVLLPAE